MANERFTSKLINRLKNMELTEADASRRREQAAIGRNIYRDRRDVRSPCYRMRIKRMRDLAIAAGLFGAIVVHEVFGINLTFCAIAFGVCGVLIFEWQRREREKREQHFD